TVKQNLNVPCNDLEQPFDFKYTILCENETAREWREKGFLLWLEEN
ncbi:6486_t:CDS:2, partial [Dentiscutata heterogama]